MCRCSGKSTVFGFQMDLRTMGKFILVLTMPSGSMWALGPDPRAPEKNRDLALFPIDKHKPSVLKGVFGFNTENEALKWIADTAKLSTQGAKLMERVTPMPADSLQ